MSRAKNGIENQLLSLWFGPSGGFPKPLQWLLTPVSWLYRAGLCVRNIGHQILGTSKRIDGLRVIAVGNLIVGGAGKTPCVIALARALKAAGLRCGIVTRGYRSEAEHQPSRAIDPSALTQTPATAIGDEAWLMGWRAQVPVAVGKDRFSSARALRAQYPDLAVVLLDDGLQQRSLQPDQTILVLDERGFGNRKCLPLGPLREPIGRLRRFDAWIDNGFSASDRFSNDADHLPKAAGQLSQTNSAWVPVGSWSRADAWLDLATGLSRFRGQRLLAVAGIAVPTRFFSTLRALGLSFEEMPLQDHDPDTVARVKERWATRLYDAVLMTEKDAVKFFVSDQPTDINAWALRRDVAIDEDFLTRFLNGCQAS